MNTDKRIDSSSKPNFINTNSFELNKKLKTTDSNINLISNYNIPKVEDSNNKPFAWSNVVKGKSSENITNSFSKATNNPATDKKSSSFVHSKNNYSNNNNNISKDIHQKNTVNGKENTQKLSYSDNVGLRSNSIITSQKINHNLNVNNNNNNYNYTINKNNSNNNNNNSIQNSNIDFNEIKENNNQHTTIKRKLNSRINSNYHSIKNLSKSLTPSDTIDQEKLNEIQCVFFNKVQSSIYFSQIRVSETSKNLYNQEIPISEFVTELFNGFKPEGAIDIVDNGNGTFTSVDNRRLFASKKIVSILRTLDKPEDFPIYVKVHHYADELEQADIRRFSREGNATTWGEAITNRMYFGMNPKQTQEIDRLFQKKQYGYRKHPKITGPLQNEVTKLDIHYDNKKITLDFKNKAQPIAVN